MRRRWREQAGSRRAPKRYKLRAGGAGGAIEPWASSAQTSREHTMKLLYFDDFKLGVLKGDAVVDVSGEVKDIPHTGPGDLMNGLIERWGSYKARLEAAAAAGRGGRVGRVPFPPPVPGPRTIDC